MRKGEAETYRRSSRAESVSFSWTRSQPWCSNWPGGHTSRSCSMSGWSSASIEATAGTGGEAAASGAGDAMVGDVCDEVSLFFSTPAEGQRSDGHDPTLVHGATRALCQQASAMELSHAERTAPSIDPQRGECDNADNVLAAGAGRAIGRGCCRQVPRPILRAENWIRRGNGSIGPRWWAGDMWCDWYGTRMM